VIDLVEVHLVRLGQPERAGEERGEQDDDHQIHVETVEPAAGLTREAGRSVRAGRRRREPVADPAHEPELGEGQGRGPAWHRRGFVGKSIVWDDCERGIADRLPLDGRPNPA
jgi:hypothetical protein